MKILYKILKWIIFLVPKAIWFIIICIAALICFFTLLFKGMNYTGRYLKRVAEVLEKSKY